MARWPWSKIPLVPSDAEILRRYREGEYPELHRWDAYRHPRLLDAVERAAMEEAKAGPYPIHGRNTMRPRMPFTWFVCNNGHRDMGAPNKEPRGDCLECKMMRWGFWNERVVTEPFKGWTPCDENGAFRAILEVEGDDGNAMYARTREGLPSVSAAHQGAGKHA